MVSPARMERHSGFPAIIPTQERIVRVDVRDGEVLGAGFLLYFHEGLVLCVVPSALHDSVLLGLTVPSTRSSDVLLIE